MDEPTVQNRRRAAVAVVSAVYPRALAAGRRSGTAAVAEYVSTATRRAIDDLGDEVDPDRTVRDLLDRLVVAAQEESLRARRPGPGGVADTPLPRTYLAACRTRGHRHDVDRVAHAAVTAWSHGYRDGWGEAYGATDRIINAIRHDELAATTALAGTPTLRWLDRLATSAHRIADSDPQNHPNRLAQLAGPDGLATELPIASREQGSTTDPAVESGPENQPGRDQHGHRRG
ncbi:hypothetical protein O7627_27470 [Solwaraspora sp. WMMD1047]|uniref:hypothetical protein n=1 Tax=Solwaraspora sp. WMMD1047 TaxID=3016102 RepID=UPI00241796CB|nr:hypothetical protein [Solwaraspora sp. WMMD1047]MDG4833017.1 hypothetical protein [Solwaraspora sp. WMMD1047]